MLKCVWHILPLGVALFLATAIAQAVDHPFTTEPNVQPYYVQENEAGPTLTCSFSENYRNRERYEPEWTRVISGTPKLLARDDNVFLKSDYALEENVESGQYNLKIKTVRFDKDNGQFFCSLLDRKSGEQILSTPATVMVVVPPNPPRITIQPSQPVRENEFVTIHCESTGGNPPPKFTWFFNNNSAVPVTWHQDRTEAAPRSTSVSVLQWRATAQDNEAFLICKTWNEGLEREKPQTIETSRVNVLFAPKVAVHPSAIVNIEEGERVDLSCDAIANPQPTQFEWQHISSGERKADTNWSFTADKRKAGDYRCSAVNSIDTGSSKLVVNVFHAPTVIVPHMLNPAEGDRLVVDCRVDANPPADQIVWTGPNGFSQVGAQLTIDAIRREHIGNYTCQAGNSFVLQSNGNAVVKRTGSGTVYVNVKRRPGAALISTTRLVINTGDMLTLSCSAEDAGSPEAKFRWATPLTNNVYVSSPEYGHSSLTINQAGLSDNGIYRCVAYNDVGEGEEAVIKLLVIDPAKITRYPNKNRVLTAGDIDSSIDCEAFGYPQPQFSWLKDGKSIGENVSPHWVIQNFKAQTTCNNDKVCLWKVTSSLRFHETVEWSDKGNYTCVAENGANGPPAKSSTMLNIIHAPVVTNDLFDGLALAATDLGTGGKVTCTVSARPEPNFIWLRNGKEVSKDDEQFHVYSSKKYNAIDEYESVLEIEDVDEKSLGTYTCQATNGQSGKTPANVNIMLVKKGKPQTPTHIRLYETSPTWLTVSWKPGFDGGDKQYFEIEYRISNPWSGKEQSKPFVFVLDESNATQVAVYKRDVESSVSGVSQVMVHNLTMLTPMTVYWYRIRSRNAYGFSDWSVLTSSSTSDAPESSLLRAPTSLLFHPSESKISFEPTKANNDTCVLLYVNENSPQAEFNGTWRATGCYPADRPIQNVKKASNFKIRFCEQWDLSKCSPGIEIHVANSSSFIWQSTILIPIAVIVAFILLCILLFVFGCRVRLPCFKRQNKSAAKYATQTKRTDVSAPITQSATKNTVLNRSTTDSGVFTFGSLAHSQPNNQSAAFDKAYSDSRNSDGGVESWQNSSEEHFEYHNDSFMPDYGTQLVNAAEFTPSYPGNAPGALKKYAIDNTSHQPDNTYPLAVSSTEQVNDSDSLCSAGGSWRVIREIIV